MNITVIQDRYSGIYSGGEFTAWIDEPNAKASADDVTCALFWKLIDQPQAGIGNSIEDAIANLLNTFNNTINDFEEIIIFNEFNSAPPISIKVFSKKYYQTFKNHWKFAPYSSQNKITKPQNNHQRATKIRFSR